MLLSLLPLIDEGASDILLSASEVPRDLRLALVTNGMDTLLETPDLAERPDFPEVTVLFVCLFSRRDAR